MTAVSAVLRRRGERAVQRLLHLYWRLARGMTLGVRAVVLDETGRVFLVRHGYVAGWHLPGGGVEAGETCRAALARELHEEGGIALTGEPQLHGLFFNGHISRRDHVAVYVVRRFACGARPLPNREIVESGFFDVGALPEGTTPGTRKRIAEVLGAAPVSSDWR